MSSFVLASSQLWWFVARASGITAWALSVLAVLWGLALSTRALGAKPRAPWLLDLHRFLGALTIVFVGVHIAGLVADTYTYFGWSEVLVPFASQWRPGAVAWGVVAFYLLLAVEITSLLKNRISKSLWKRVHYASYLMYAFGTIHLITAGTDASNGLLRWMAVASVGLVAFFTLYRAIGPGRAASVRPASTAPGSRGSVGVRA